MKYFVSSLALCAVAVVFFYAQHSAGAAPAADASALYQGKVSFISDSKAAGENGAAPDFSWYDENGKTVSLKDYRGKVVFLNFWGTWCPPCRHELPDIVALEKQYRGKVKFIGVALERSKDNLLQRLTGFANTNGMEYQILVGSPEIAKAYGGISGIPTTFIIDKTGKIIDSAVGMRDKEQFEGMLKKAM